MKANELIATIPGLSSGSATAMKPRRRPHPSIHEASSSSMGMLRMNPIIKITESGRWKTVSATTMLHRLLIKPVARNTSKSGISIIAPGMNCVHSSSTRNASGLLKRNISVATGVRAT